MWRLAVGQRTALVTYDLRLWQKSLVIDVRCDGNEIGEFRIGKVVGLTDPRLVTLPYLVGAEQRPAVLVAGPVEQPLFVSALLDHCRTNSSLFWFANQVADDGATSERRFTLPAEDRRPAQSRLRASVRDRFSAL